MAQLLFVMICLLPLMVLFFLPGGRLMANAMMFWLLLFFCLSLIWSMLGRSAAAPDAPVVVEEPQVIPVEHVPPVVTEVMDVGFALDRAGIQTYFGQLREPADVAYDRLRSVLPSNVMPLLQQEERYGTALILLPRAVERPNWNDRCGRGSTGCCLV